MNAEQATTLRYRGVIRLAPHGEAHDILFVGDDDYPLADIVSDDIHAHGNWLSVRYWTAANQHDDDAMAEGAIRAFLGYGDADFGHAYSEITGYLYTDERLQVGGHDLIAELASHAGRYCLLEITYNRSAP